MTTESLLTMNYLPEPMKRKINYLLTFSKKPQFLDNGARVFPTLSGLVQRCMARNEGHAAVGSAGSHECTFNCLISLLLSHFCNGN